MRFYCKNRSLEPFWLRVAHKTVLALCFNRNVYLKTASHFSEIALWRHLLHVCICFVAVTLSPIMFSPVFAAGDYDRLIERARQGDTNPALVYLQQMGGNATSRMRIDHILIASWAERPGEVIELYQHLPIGDRTLPMGAMQAVGRAFRDLKRYDEAISVLKEGMAQYEAEAAGLVTVLVMTLADAGRVSEAVKTGEAWTKLHPQDADLRLALAYAYVKQAQPFSALRQTEKAYQLMPKKPYIQDEYIRALQRVGRFDEALVQARKMPTGYFSAAEIRNMEADALAMQIRLVAQSPDSEAERFAPIDQIIARYDELIADWKKLGASAASDLTRIRIDRLVALQARLRVEDLVRDYNSLLAEGIEVPIWARSHVVSAYLAMDNSPAAQALMEELVALAPDDVDLRANFAGIYRLRAQPRQAGIQLQLAGRVDPHALAIALGQGVVALDLQEWQRAEALITDLLVRFPEDLAVQDLARRWQIHNMAEWRVGTAKDFSPDSPVNGSGDFGMDTVYYTPPFAYNWRFFTGIGYGQGKYREGNGSYRWLRTGAQWRSRDWWAEGEVSAHHYAGQNKIGVRFAVAHDLNDYWRIGGSVEHLSRFSSMRALRSNIYTDVAQFYVNWRAHERREWRLGLEGTHFSDDNNRVSVELNGIERLYSAPHLRLDLLLNISSQFNSKDDDRPYFNPEYGVMLLPSLRGTQILKRHDEKVWEHYATLSAGSYRQKNYATSDVFVVEYGQRYRHDDMFEIGAAINHIRRPYDGKYEREWRLRFDLTSRF